MLGALVLLPALAHFLLKPARHANVPAAEAGGNLVPLAATHAPKAAQG
jgi:hypothetical protein